MRVVTDNPMAA